MNKKNSTKDNLNLFFSAFLILGYLVCGCFFVNFAETQSGLVKGIIIALTFVVFGAILFYATRVGEGKPVKRFSIVTLCMVDIPALYIILASLISVLPLHNILVDNAVVFYMSAVALGYGIPYTFLSGFELVVESVEESAEEIVEEPQEVLEGGIEQEIQETTEAEEAEEVSEETEEIAVDGVDAEETVEETAETVEENAEADEDVKAEEE